MMDLPARGEILRDGLSKRRFRKASDEIGRIECKGCAIGEPQNRFFGRHREIRILALGASGTDEQAIRRNRLADCYLGKFERRLPAVVAAEHEARKRALMLYFP